MRIVLDTNVLVSGLFFGGVPGRILEAWRRGTVRIVASDEMLAEYRRIALAMSAAFPGFDLTEFTQLLAREVLIAEPAAVPADACEDAKDICFLGAALGSNTKIIVSGDKHLLRISGYQGIQIVRPRAFIDSFLNG